MLQHEQSRFQYPSHQQQRCFGQHVADTQRTHSPRTLGWTGTIVSNVSAMEWNPEERPISLSSPSWTWMTDQAFIDTAAPRWPPEGRPTVQKTCRQSSGNTLGLERLNSALGAL
jgi:hypothetical protein